MAINLLPWRQWEYQRRKRFLIAQWIMGFILIFGIGLMGQYWFMQVFKKQEKNIHELKQQLFVLDQEGERWTEQEKYWRRQTSQKQFIERELANHQQVVKLLEQLSVIVPDGIYLTRLEKKSSTLMLSGKAQSHSDIAVLLNKMEVLVREERLLLTETSHIDKNTDEIDFNLTYEISLK